MSIRNVFVPLFVPSVFPSCRSPEREGEARRDAKYVIATLFFVFFRLRLFSYGTTSQCTGLWLRMMTLVMIIDRVVDLYACSLHGQAFVSAFHGRGRMLHRSMETRVVGGRAELFAWENRGIESLESRLGLRER